MRCWSCQADGEKSGPFCSACGKVQPAAPGTDHFATLGLPRRYAVDRGEMERSFRELSRQLHPDRFARATPRERRISLERATRVNDAYRTLRDQRRRAEYLLRLAGHDPIAEARMLQDPGFLEEQLALRETLEEAKAAGDVATRRRLVGEARAKLGCLEEEIAVLFAEHESGRAALAEIVRRVSRARYYDQVVADAEAGNALEAGPAETEV